MFRFNNLHGWSQKHLPDMNPEARKKSYFSKTKEVSQEKESEEALAEIIELMAIKRSPRSVGEGRVL